MTPRPYDRSTQDVGNVVALEHVNVTVEDQRRAVDFYCGALELTRDPYVDFGDRNLWVNVGSQQLHLPTAARSQVFVGTIGMVVPDLAGVRRSGVDVLAEEGDQLLIACPWGNRIRLHAPSDRFGGMRMGIPYLEMDVAPGAAAGIGRFYESVLGAPVTVAAGSAGATTEVSVGCHQRLRFTETEDPIPDYDGHHIAIYVSGFSGPYEALQELGAISRETSEHEYRFVDIVDPDSGECVARLEHEVRSLHHPLFGRPLVNRTPGNPYSMTDGFEGYDIHAERFGAVTWGGRP